MAISNNEPLFDALENQFFGKYRGVVEDNIDKTSRGRLQVIVPTVMGDEKVWALPCVPYAGNGVGFFALPPTKSAVWIEFEGGDPTYPIWVGCFWGKDQINTSDSSPDIKFWRTDKTAIRIDDSEGSITIETAGGAKLIIGSSEISIEANTVNQTANSSKTVLTASGFDVNNGAFTVN